MYQGWLVVLSPAIAPVTGVPAPPATPADCSTVGKVMGWPWLSLRLRLIQYDQPALLLPMEALVFQLR
jgi:hypothetical protein